MDLSAESMPLPWDLNPIWSVLTPLEKETISNRLVVRHFKKNEVIHEDGEKPSFAMMLVKGKVRIWKAGNSQRQQIIRLLKPFDFFGYRAIFAEENYNAGATAFEPCTVYMLDKETFVQLLKQNNRFCYLMLQMLARDLGISEIQTVNLTQKHIRGRLAESILNLRSRYGLKPEDQSIDIQIAREDLANMSNMTTSNAIRTLSQFASEGLVEVEGRNIKILNEHELDKISRLG